MQRASECSVVIGDEFFLFDRQDEASVWGPFAGVWLALQMLASVGVTFNKLKVPRLQSTIKM